MISENERLDNYAKIELFKENWFALAVSMLTKKSCKQSLLEMGLIYTFEGDKDCYEPQRLSNRQRRTWKIEKEWIIECRCKGLSNTQMAAILGCSNSAITLAAQRFGIITYKKDGTVRKTDKRN